MSILYYLLGLLFGAICVFLILLILIQKGRGGGLSSAFGGAGGNTAFGSKTGDVLTWVTSSVFVLFLLLAMSMIWVGDAVHADGTRYAADQTDAMAEDAETDGVNGADEDGDGVGTGGTDPLGNVDDPDDEALAEEVPGDNP